MTDSMIDDRLFSSRAMAYLPGEVFAPPMVTNEWAEAQACRDPVAYRFFSAPPFATAEGAHAECYLRLPEQDRVVPLNALGAPVTTQWFPDRVVRHMTVRGLRFSSVLSLAAGRDVLLLDVTITNLESTSQSGLKLFVKLLSGVQRLKNFANWNTVALPAAGTTVDEARHAFIFCGNGPAYSVQGMDQPSLDYRASVAFAEWMGDANLNGIVSNRARPVSVYAGFAYEIDLPPGESWRLRYVNALGGSVEAALDAYDDARAHFETRQEQARAIWQSEIEAAFTVGNDRFSGSLPALEGAHDSLRQLYATGALNLLFMKRSDPRNRFGTSYKTISPRSGATSWLWDTQQAASGLIHLDPLVLKTMVEWWMRTDIHRCWGTNYLNGAPLGPWYSVNDYALFTMAYHYLRYSGDFGWLDQPIEGRTVLGHLQSCADHWCALNADDYLADYGEPRNLLECVPTYMHKVAALNAANAWMNRTLAEIEARRGDTASARQRRRAAQAISRAVLELYRPGGYFACRQPDGREIDVQHCYDFGVVMATLFDDLGPRRRAQMIRFFQAKLQTSSWMRALAEDDPAAAFSQRTDHTATGAYTSWPAYGLLALCRTGHLDEALAWIGVGNESGGLAGVARQGPFGQAAFHGGPGSLLDGHAARKAPDDPPHYEEWIDVAGGAYVGAVIEGVFGVNATLYDGISASAALHEVQPGARLTGLAYQGRRYDVVDGALRIQT
jgi:hypothetical protein